MPKKKNNKQAFWIVLALAIAVILFGGFSSQEKVTVEAGEKKCVKLNDLKKDVCSLDGDCIIDSKAGKCIKKRNRPPLANTSICVKSNDDYECGGYFGQYGRCGVNAYCSDYNSDLDLKHAHDHTLGHGICVCEKPSGGPSGGPGRGPSGGPGGGPSGGPGGSPGGGNGGSCNPDQACLQVITCCDGELYPTACCDSNCNEPIGECNAGGGSCNPNKICGQAITCCDDGQFYPTTCCSSNCNKPIGECNAGGDGTGTYGGAGNTSD